MNSLEISVLPVSEKLQLMELLWDSLCRETSGECDVPSWHQDVRVERLHRLDNGENTLAKYSLADMMKNPLRVPGFTPLSRESEDMQHGQKVESDLTIINPFIRP